MSGSTSNDFMKMILHVFAILVLFLIYVRYLENKSVFYPEKDLRSTPRELGLSFEDVFIKTKDRVSINGWLIKHPSAKATLIFLHGNAGNMGDRLGKIALFYDLGVNILIIDYRGYGKSGGYPTERGVYNDALAACDFIKQRDDLKDMPIIGYGASLGGAIAVDLASNRSLNCLILDSTFSSAVDMAKHIYPFVPHFLIRTKLDSASKIRNVSIPVLFIHSIDDRTVPIALGRKLYEASSGRKKFIEIQGDHNDGYIFDETKVKEGMRDFLKEQDLVP